MSNRKKRARVRVQRNPNGTYSVQYRVSLLGIPLMWWDAEHGLFDADKLDAAIVRANRLAEIRSAGFETVYEIK